MNNLTPKQIVEKLDKYIVGQDDAKKAVAIALRNRWRRQQVSEELRDEINPNNIIMIGSTGIGKTEIARRLAKLTNSPFLKVEASKFTEVGYVGKDVESMIRDLADIAVNMVKEEKMKAVKNKAEENVFTKIANILNPKPKPPKKTVLEREIITDQDDQSIEEDDSNLIRNLTSLMEESFKTLNPEGPAKVYPKFTPKKLERKEYDYQDPDYLEKLAKWRIDINETIKKLRNHELDDIEIELKRADSNTAHIDIIPLGIEDLHKSINSLFSNMMPKQPRKRKMKIKDAVRVLVHEESTKLVDMDKAVQEAIDIVQNNGLIFIDEIDKIAGEKYKSGPDVSREGVQRDILPIVEGSNIYTKYGMINTQHILFIAAGAFHVSKPSDLIPELQGRFPIRVELKSLTEEDFKRILVEPENSLIKQYTAMIKTEGTNVAFDEASIHEIAHFAFVVNEKMEDIGARRLHTIMTTLLEDILFDLPDARLDITSSKEIVIGADFVRETLEKIIEDEDLSKYIL